MRQWGDFLKNSKVNQKPIPTFVAGSLPAGLTLKVREVRELREILLTL
jgi:hypothetical protein